MTRELGLLDTNLFVHLLFPNDPHYGRCRSLIAALDSGAARGRIEQLVVHELSDVLQRTGSFPSRRDIVQFLYGILAMESIEADDKGALTEALLRWENGGMGFTDAWLGVQAARRGLAVCSVNDRDFPAIENTFFAPET